MGIAFIIYFIGFILAHGRLIGMFEEINDEFPELPFNWKWYWRYTALALSSWLGFIAGVWIYFEHGDKYFLKYNIDTR